MIYYPDKKPSKKDTLITRYIMYQSTKNKSLYDIYLIMYTRPKSVPIGEEGWNVSSQDKPVVFKLFSDLTFPEAGRTIGFLLNL